MMHSLKRISLIALLGAVATLSAKAVDLKTHYAEWRFDKKGYITKITDISTGTNYVPKDVPSPLIMLYDGKNYIKPVQLRTNGDHLCRIFVGRSTCSEC